MSPSPLIGEGGGGTLYDFIVWMIKSELIRIHMVCLDTVTVYSLINKDLVWLEIQLLFFSLIYHYANGDITGK